MVLDILAKVKGYCGDSMDEVRIENALEFVDLHSRANGRNYEAPFLMLESILPLKPDDETIIVTLLHDLHVLNLVDGDSIKNTFGERVLRILNSVRKLEDIPFNEDDRSVQIENLRNMILVMAKDIRVIVVVLACSLYKMQNLKKLIKDKDERYVFSKKVMSLYVPIAERLGIYRMKSQLEDLAFMYLNPREYKKIAGELKALSRSCQISIAYIKEKLDRFLGDRGIKAKVSGRVKNVYSIYKKLKKKGLSSVDDLYDVYAMRIVLPAKTDDPEVDETDHIYSVLGVIHGEWRPISSRFKDYIAVPKPNGYRSLHTVVLGLSPRDIDQPVEIQIRDKNMHREAEYGFASHWFYKEAGSYSYDLSSRKTLIKGLEGIRSEFDLDYDVLKDVELDVFNDRIFVLTPRGEVKDLPLGSVPLDFAYAIHTDIGNKCVMAKVNGKIVALNYELKNNDVVEIITRKDASPKLRWLSIVKTNAAKNKIKAWFSSQNKDSHLKEGKKLINDQLQRLGKPLLDSNYSILKEFGGQKLSFFRREGLIEEVGNGGKIASDIIKKIYPYRDILERNVSSSRSLKKSKVGDASGESLSLEERVLVGGEADLPVKIAACCNPLFGKSILGYVTRGKSITIHSSSCKLLYSLDSERIIFASWKDSDSGGRDRYLLGIKVEGISRIGLMSEITSVISNLGFQIRDVYMKDLKSGISEEYFLIEIDDIEKFDSLFDKLESIRGVLRVTRDNRLKPKN
jgi:GTP pyrophosphokinase